MEEKIFISQELKRTISINEIVSVFYSDLTPHFTSKGEVHDFWEFVYVDRGLLHISTDNGDYTLAQGQIAFHPPMQYHRHFTNTKQITSLCVAAFHCECPELFNLASQPFYLDENQRYTLSLVEKYASEVFSSVVDAKDVFYLERKHPCSNIYEQLFRNYLETFLLLCLNNSGKISGPGREAKSSTYENRAGLLGQQIADYLSLHVKDRVTIDELCKKMNCSKTTLSTSFRAYMGSSIIDYFNMLKIEAAKALIQKDTMSLSEISNHLNFCNLNYFSKAFKKYSGMLPSEYVKSIKIRNGAYLVSTGHNVILHDAK